MVWKFVYVKDEQEGAQYTTPWHTRGDGKGRGESAIDHYSLGSVGEIELEPGPQFTSDAHFVGLLQTEGRSG